MEIDPATLAPRDAYRLMTSCVIPRPIGWISTLSADGVANLAPFSYFGAITSSPFTVMLSVGRRKGERKDTSRNLLANGEGVVHIPHRPLAEAMVATAAELPPEVDEFEHAGLTKVAASVVAPPRVAEAAIAMEGRVSHHMEVGKAPMDVFFLEIARLHFDEAIMTEGLVDARRLDAVGRLGGSEYCSASDVFPVVRS